MAWRDLYPGLAWPGQDVYPSAYWVDDETVTIPDSGAQTGFTGRKVNAKWSFHLIVSETMERLGELDQARGRSLQLIYNRSGNAAFTIPINDDLFAEAEPVKHGIAVYRNNVPIWSGMIWTNDDQLPQDRVGVTCVGWFETLNHRILRRDVSYPRFSTVPLKITGGGVVFLDPYSVETDDAYHPGGLLTIANAQHDTWISEGIDSDQMERIVSYTRGQSIGQAITDLSDTEAGFNFTIDPITRQMHIKNWSEYEDKTDSVVFGYNWGPNNLAALGRQTDASTMANRVTSFGKYGGGLAEDIPSQEEYQLFEEEVQLSDVVDPNVLLAYSGGEVLLRKTPRILYSPAPFPWVAGRTPQPFVDYGLGDKVLFTAKKGERVNVIGQAVRVFGMNVTITEEGNEKLDALQIVPGG